MMMKISNYTRNPEFKKNVQRLNKLNNKVRQVDGLLKPFVTQDWCFESKRALELMDMLDDEEKALFNFNPKTI